LRSEWTTFWESFQPSFCVLLGNFHISSTFLSWILSSILHPFIYSEICYLCSQNLIKTLRHVEQDFCPYKDFCGV
jgi:hypothetical protein